MRGGAVNARPLSSLMRGIKNLDARLLGQQGGDQRAAGHGGGWAVGWVDVGGVGLGDDGGGRCGFVAELASKVGRGTCGRVSPALARLHCRRARFGGGRFRLTVSMHTP